MIFESAILETVDIRKLAFFATYLFCAIAYFFGKTKKEIKRPPEPLIFAKSVTTIKYAKQPPLPSSLSEAQSGSQFTPQSVAIQELSIAEFLPNAGLKRWTDSLVASEKDHPKIRNDYKNILDAFNPAHLVYRLYDFLFPIIDSNNTPLEIDHSQFIQDRIEERLLNPLNSFIICEIHPEVGKGVFLAEDAKPLAKDTIIGIYSGEYLLKKSHQLYDSTYIMSLFGMTKKTSFKSAPHINAKEYGNITRFFQDLPAEEELKSIPAKLLPDIATENLKALGAIYRGVPLLYFITSKVIEPGEQIGFSYRGNYWIKGREGKRRIFNRKGEIIGRFVNSNKIQFENFFIHQVNKNNKNENN